MSIDLEQTELDADGCVLHGGEPYSGQVVRRGPHGEVVSLTTYYKGYEDGLSQEWYPDGRPRIEGTSRYRVGAVGVWREWHPSGARAAEYGFSDNGRLQFVRRWDPAGTMIEDKTY
jgi:antitoxin component YwqK of YwqJK toxin-antitoxin module